LRGLLLRGGKGKGRSERRKERGSGGCMIYQGQIMASVLNAPKWGSGAEPPAGVRGQN